MGCGEISGIDGFLSILICEDGGERLLLTGAVRPRVVIDENPVKDVLKIS
jgi:hypothetical protein